MTWAQLERGLARCSDSDDEWPPSLPKFKRYCKITPQELGLPSLEEAYRMARQQIPDWSQVYPVVYHARFMVGLDTIIKESDSIAWPRFEKAYQALVGRVLAGEVFGSAGVFSAAVGTSAASSGNGAGGCTGAFKGIAG